MYWQLYLHTYIHYRVTYIQQYTTLSTFMADQISVSCIHITWLILVIRHIHTYFSFIYMYIYTRTYIQLPYMSHSYHSLTTPLPPTPSYGKKLHLAFSFFFCFTFTLLKLVCVAKKYENFEKTTLKIWKELFFIQLLFFNIITYAYIYKMIIYEYNLVLLLLLFLK